jgi:putative hemolysin
MEMSEQTVSRGPLIRLRPPRRLAWVPGLEPLLRLAERITRISGLNWIYARTQELEARRYWPSRMLEAMEVVWEASEGDLERIPAEGPLVVVCNHPFGGVECAVLAELLRKVRPDVKILANHLLKVVPELDEVCIYVDPFGGEKAAEANMRPVKECFRWLREGGALAFFPAGEVSHWSWREREVCDGPWAELVGRIARRTGAATVPIFFPGRNDALFQLAGLLHPRARTALLPRQLMKRCRTRIQVCVGAPIPARRLQALDDDAEATAYLRRRTYLRPPLRAPPLAPPRATGEVEKEIAALPAGQRLYSSAEFEVCCARAAQIPTALLELGRLRELTFREVGEGTGRPLDLDDFDQTYLQLFLWNRKERELVGAYRMGLADELLSRGPKALYTYTLFEMAPPLLARLGTAIEMGRSFVRPEYQGAQAMNRLWRGIGRFMRLHPRYRFLFGPVSITNEYSMFSRQLLVFFLKTQGHMSELADYVRPRRAFPERIPREVKTAPACKLLTSLSELAEVISEVEPDRKGVPVLLRWYLRMNGKLLGFNLDPDFGNTLDGLILVDLCLTDRRIMEHFMGKEDAAAYLACQVPPSAEHGAAAPRLEPV